MASQPEQSNNSDAQIRRISEFRKGSKSKKQAQPVYMPKGITRLTVAGFKSISREQSIEWLQNGAEPEKKRCLGFHIKDSNT